MTDCTTVRLGTSTLRTEHQAGRAKSDGAPVAAGDRVELTGAQRREISMKDVFHFGKAAPVAAPADIPSDAPIFGHIEHMWDVLQRDCTDPASLKDDKSGERPILYISAGEKAPEIPGIEVRRLPRKGSVKKDGLLYLPHPYIVPGGRFNEMYGWDSHFITLGLLDSGRVDMAKNVTENLFYELDNYGKVLNANRTYYLERANPPFLGGTSLEIYGKTHDREWLQKAVGYAEKEHDFWMKPPRMTATGLARYYGEGSGPCPEVEPGYYDKLPRNAEFNCHDRAERESGWDMTDRFSYRCADFNPVCLNSLLYKEEKDIAKMHRILEGDDSTKAAAWEKKAEDRARLITKYLWNDEEGFFGDYDFTKKRTSSYESIASFYALYAGVATPEQAARTVKGLEGLEGKGGLATSTHVSGKQWDLPYGWAPLQLLAVRGMRNYGFDDKADDCSRRFLKVVNDVYTKEGSIKEKYDVADASSKADVGYGNQEGFGWTNGAFLALRRDLEARRAG